MLIKLGENERKLATNTFFLYVMQLSGYIFPLLTFPYLTRVLGPSKYGVIVFSTAVMAYFQLFLEFGFILSATNEVSINREDKNKLRAITYSVIWSKIILAVCGLFILFVLMRFVDKLGNDKSFFYLSYISTVITIFLPDFFFRGIEKMSVITYRVIISKFLYTLCVFLFIRKSDDYINFPIASIVANIFAVVLTWYELLKKYNINYIHVSFSDIINALKKSSVFFLSRIAVSIYQTLNTVLLGVKYSPSQIACYGASNNLVSSARGLFSPISDSIYPYMIKNRNYKLVKKIILIIEPVVILGCIFIYILAPTIIRVFCGSGYEDSIPIFRSMLPLIIISLPTYLLGYPFMGALGKISVANNSVICGAIFHILGLILLFLLGVLNSINVAMLTFLTEMVVFTIRIIVVIRSSGVVNEKK